MVPIKYRLTPKFVFTTLEQSFISHRYSEGFDLKIQAIQADRRLFGDRPHGRGPMTPDERVAPEQRRLSVENGPAPGYTAIHN